MGSRERRNRERAGTRQRILDAARDLFVLKGYEATTMRAIADRIEYTPTAIYHHFRNKEALLVELCVADFRSLRQAFERIGRVEDPVERLRRIGQAYVNFAIEHPMHYQTMFMITRPVLPPDAKQPAPATADDPGEDAYCFLKVTCEEVIEKGLLRPEYDDADELAQMLWSAMHGLVSLNIVHIHDDWHGWLEWRDVGATAMKICDSLLRGMLRAGS